MCLGKKIDHHCAVKYCMVNYHVKQVGSKKTVKHNRLWWYRPLTVFISQALSFDAHSLTVPVIKWLGVLPSDINRYLSKELLNDPHALSHLPI